MADSFEAYSDLPPEVLEHYASGYESQRLLGGSSRIELVRTQELILRHVPPPPAVIFDVGGGSGMYACWLARKGYEVHRILRPGGIICVVGISRFTSALDGLRQGFLDDPAFVQVVERDLADGQHRNPMNHPAYFTTAFFHDPKELKAEVEESGFQFEKTLPIEGPLWLSSYVTENFSDPRRREQFLMLMRRLEQEPSLLGISAHLLVVARKAEP